MKVLLPWQRNPANHGVFQSMLLECAHIYGHRNPVLPEIIHGHRNAVESYSLIFGLAEFFLCYFFLQPPQAWHFANKIVLAIS